MSEKEWSVQLQMEMVYVFGLALTLACIRSREGLPWRL